MPTMRSITNFEYFLCFYNVIYEEYCIAEAQLLIYFGDIEFGGKIDNLLWYV